MTPSVPDTRAELLSELQSLAKSSAKLLTTAEVALLFGVGDRTIRIWAEKNWIPALHNPSGHWKFSATEIMQTYQECLQEVRVLPKRTSRRK